MVRLDLKSMLGTKKGYAIMHSNYHGEQMIELYSLKRDWTIEENFWADVKIWQERQEIAFRLGDCTILPTHNPELDYILEKGLDDVMYRTMNVVKLQYTSKRGSTTTTTLIPLDKGGK